MRILSFFMRKCWEEGWEGRARERSFVLIEDEKKKTLRAHELKDKVMKNLFLVFFYFLNGKHAPYKYNDKKVQSVKANL